MARLIYLTHPQVVIDPEVPVVRWGLNAVGQQRVAAFVARGAAQGVTHVASSDEQKALDTAEPIAIAWGLSVEVRPAMGENDRSATGFLPGPEFEATADAFFARPSESVRGWETAQAAQARVVAEAEAVMAAHPGDILCVGHGAVGTLLMCHLGGLAISRQHDQGPGGGGNVFVYDRDAGRLVHAWCPMEEALSRGAPS